VKAVRSLDFRSRVSSGAVGETVSEVRVEREWRHSSEASIVEETAEPMLGMTSVLAPRSFAPPGRWRERHRDSHQRPRRYAGGAGEQLPACRAPRLPPGGRATRVAGASGASAPSVPVRSDSAGTRTPCSMTRAVRVRASAAATPERFSSGDTFVPAGNSAELGARRR
jgi:hypothetical protein